MVSKVGNLKLSKEQEGKIEKGKVKPFGTSAHIPFKKKHTGRIVDVVIPTKGKYTWLINLEERKSLFKSAKKNIEKANGKLEHYRLQLIDDLKNEEFGIDSLIKILALIP